MVRLIGALGSSYKVRAENGTILGTTYLGTNNHWQVRATGGRFVTGGPGYIEGKGYQHPQTAADALELFLSPRRRR